MRLLPTFFVLKSDDLPSENMLSGYYFRGKDLFVDRPIKGGGDSSKAEVLPRDLDGIYAAVEARPGEVRISVDHAGTIPLFLYRTHGFWAVSPSFQKLLGVAKARGDNLDLEPDLLQAWRITGAFGQYPRNFQTCVSQVQLVPSYCHLIGTSESITMVPREKPANRSYEAALNRYRTTMGRRFRSIAKTQGTLVFDITGGIDSRSILATALEAFEGDEIRDLHRQGRILLRTNRNNQIDFAIATKIAQELDLDLIHTMPWTRKQREGAKNNRAISPTSLSGGDLAGENEILDRLAETCLGRRAFLGLDNSQPPALMFASSGVFGGNLKSPNKNDKTVEDGRRFLRRFRKHFDSAELHARWVDRTIEDVLEVQRYTGGDKLPFWPLFNREFMMRLHARASLGSHRLYPLASRHLTEAVNCLDWKYLAKNGVHHDLINAGSPSLYEIEYDKAYKNPPAGFRPRALPGIDNQEIGAMRVKQHKARPDDIGPPVRSDLSAYKVARNHALELAARPDIQAFMGDAYCKRVRDEVSNFPEENGSTLSGNRLSLLHGPLFAEMLLKLGNFPKADDKRRRGRFF